jgi:anti-anti-sigma factor
MPFRADVLDRPSEATIVLHGDVSADAEQALSEAYAAATRNGAPSVLLDFGDIGFMNSTGIALVVELLAEATRDDRRLRATHLSAHYREIFEITRLAEYITVVDIPAPESVPTGGTA